MLIGVSAWGRRNWQSFCIDLAPGHMNEAPNENRIHSWRFVSLVCKPYIGLMSRVFDNGRGDWSSIPSWVIPKTRKMLLDAALLNSIR